MVLTAGHCQIKPDPGSLMTSYQQPLVMKYGMSPYFTHIDKILLLLCYRISRSLLECISDGEGSARHDSGDSLSVRIIAADKSANEMNNFFMVI